MPRVPSRRRQPTGARRLRAISASIVVHGGHRHPLFLAPRARRPMRVIPLPILGGLLWPALLTGLRGEAARKSMDPWCATKDRAGVFGGASRSPKERYAVDIPRSTQH
jgi:hypothetical protein